MQGPNADATPGEITGMRGLIGSVSWATREGMPYGAGDTSILASTLPQPKVKDLQEANAALRRLKQNDVPIRIHPILLERLRLLLFADSSLGNAKGGFSQLGHLLCSVDKSIFDVLETDCSALIWKSHKMRRAERTPSPASQMDSQKDLDTANGLPPG